MRTRLRLYFPAGSVPLDSFTAEKEMQLLRVRRKQPKSHDTTFDQASGYDGHLGQKCDLLFLFGHAQFGGHQSKVCIICSHVTVELLD